VSEALGRSRTSGPPWSAGVSSVHTQADTGVGTRPAPGRLTVGVSGRRRNAAVAVCENGVLTASCEQERLIRVRGVPLEPHTFPVEALSAVLGLAGDRPASDVQHFAVAEDAIVLPHGTPVVHVEHHLAHAASAFYASPFRRAAVLVCDEHSSPELSVWVADGERLSRHRRSGTAGLASLYSACTQLFGFRPGQEHQLEALARLHPGAETGRLEGSIGYRDGDVWTSPGWSGLLAEWLDEENGRDPIRHRAHVASAFQRHLGRVLLDVAGEVRASTGMRHLCLAGGLFYNTFFNTVVRQSGLFDDVTVAPNPGNAGLAAGAALVASQVDGHPPTRAASPFLGPGYGAEEIKRTLDNCKLSYECLSEGETIAATVDALQRGRLVGWFQGRMEWAHRALGNRSILASPCSAYVLDNLNVFLKQRESHRTYGLSVRESDVDRWFVGPPVSRFMEYEYEVRDRERLRHVLPWGATTLRVQTVPDCDESRRYWLLHKMFGEATGLPILVNTSFNGFSEPIVCSPRDAIRVFFGTGLDMLVLDRFVVWK
jgi:carbamoyltransferase